MDTKGGPKKKGEIFKYIYPLINFTRNLDELYMD